MKKIYTQPEWKVVAFKVEDVITASGGNTTTTPFNYGELDEGAVSWEW